MRKRVRRKSAELKTEAKVAAITAATVLAAESESEMDDYPIIISPNIPVQNAQENA